VLFVTFRAPPPPPPPCTHTPLVGVIPQDRPPRGGAEDSYSFHCNSGKVRLSLCFFVTEHHTMKAYCGSRAIAPHILDLGTTWRRVVSFIPQSLYPQGKSSWYPLDRRLGGPQSRSGDSGEDKNYQPLSGLKPPIIHPVAQCYTTVLSQLLIWVIFLKITNGLHYTFLYVNSIIRLLLLLWQIPEFEI
jgi:hypothetical protein